MLERFLLTSVEICLHLAYLGPLLGLASKIL